MKPLRTTIAAGIALTVGLTACAHRPVTPAQNPAADRPTVVTASSPATVAAPVVTYETVTLTPAAALVWEGRAHETIETQRIGGPVAITLDHCTDIVISACDLTTIKLVACTGVTIRNSWFHHSADVGIQLYQSRQVLVQGCRFEDVASGVYAIESQQVQVVGNFARNVQGPFPRGQMVQFDNVTGAGNAIRGNYAINDRGQSLPEDVINLFQSSGTAESPILVEDNYLTGDATAGSAGKSKNGSGIMLADGGGAHQVCRHNVIIAAGQVGIGVAGGRVIRVENNLIYGERSDVANVGLYVWNQSKQASDHVTVSGNRVYWVNHDGEQNPWWAGGGVEALVEQDNQWGDTALATHLPTAPTTAPQPPQPWTTRNAAGQLVAPVPWPLQ